ncbi:methyltransferase domain-containing protein [Cyanobacteria bacterium FACHB-472]|nr:methyltransferase domain-containing protein [Cyanobacteria bacterium FACHB-472]
MKKVQPQDSWCESWKYSYPYDLLEIYGDMSYRGYAYAYANRRQHTLELVQKIARPGAKVLDVAAGQGNFTLSLAELGYEVTWNDLREELVDYVKLKWERGVIHYVPGDIFSLGFKGCFDVILITEIIEHVAHPDEFLYKIAQLVKVGGYIVMSTPNGEYFQNRLPKFSDCPDPSQFEEIQFQPNADGHIFLLHLDEFELLAKKAGLTVVESRLFTNTLTNGHLKLGTVLKLVPHTWVDACESFTCSLPFSWRKKIHTGMICLLSRSSAITS